MTRTFALIALAASACFLDASTLRAESAAETFAQGEQLLKQGDLAGALDAYAKAAQDDRNNREYMQHYTILRRIMQLRKSLDSEQNETRLENTARGLYAFYVNERLYDEALSLGKLVHEKFNNRWSAVMLAETYLSMDRNAEAAQTLAVLDVEEASPMTQALMGIALTRDGKRDMAKEIAGAIQLSENPDPQVVYAVARLNAAVGENPKAGKLLAQCLESIAPSRQDGFKDHAKSCPEFAAMAATPEFANILDTKSKVPESKCSGGSNCAGCPMRGKCPHGG